MIQRSLVLIKPGAVKRGLVGRILMRYESKGLKLVAMKFMRASRQVVGEHYKEHEEKDFYPSLMNHLTSGPLVAMVWEGRKAIEVIRKINGSTNPDDAQIGTIRGDFALHVGRNVVHASDSVENGKREIGIWFDTSSELVDWKKLEFQCLYDSEELQEEETELKYGKRK